MEFVTIARFPTPPPAHLAAGALREAGVPVLLRNEEVVAGAWDLGQASFGVEVRVPLAERERAREVLGALGHGADVAFDPDEVGAADSAAAAADEDSEPPPDEWEVRARSAWKAAVASILVPLLVPYVVYVIADIVFRSGRTPLSRPARRHLLLAVVATAVSFLFGASLFLLYTRVS